MKILVDINIPKRIHEKLRELGFDAVYLKDVLPPDASDKKIVKWLRENRALILTKDKRFPETEDGKKIVLAGTTRLEKLSREAIHDLIVFRIFPHGLEDSAELNTFASFLREGTDPFFMGIQIGRRRKST
jgi:predicted nuclease of predicted toxin-antitoxin system